MHRLRCGGVGAAHVALFGASEPLWIGQIVRELGRGLSDLCHVTADGYIVIGTFQHFEYYTYAALDNQKRDAQKLIDSGAVIVSGSQAHHPQAFEFSNDGFVHHGLGNLFFDQYSVSYGARQGFIDQHVFYNGKHISTELLTILFVDYARARPMTPAERTELLTTIFRASGW